MGGELDSPFSPRFAVTLSALYFENSAIVSRPETPTLCAKSSIQRGIPLQGGVFGRWLEALYRIFEFYRYILDWVFSHKDFTRIDLMTAVRTILSMWLFLKGFFPQLWDTGMMIGTTEGSVGTSPICCHGR
jgi:multidrug efflux pump subunit AcrB